MEPVTTDEVIRTCAVQAVRIEKLTGENARLSADLAAAKASAQAADAEVQRLRGAAPQG